MSKMKSANSIIMLAMAMGGDRFRDHSSIKEEETEEEKQQKLIEAEIKRNKARGLKKFSYGENSVWAINKKNADKKARRNHWI